MHYCTTCNMELLPEDNFCGACGCAVKKRCNQCQTSNPARFAFCGGCGGKLDQAAAAALNPGSATLQSDGERRQISVLFCDLIGSTHLSECLDPEELRQVLLAYQEYCVRTVQALDGYIAKFLGDGILAYFGYPQVHEDSAYRAARAGFEITQNIATLNEKLQAAHKIQISVRVGIHTGMVVIARMGAGDSIEESAVVGKVPNIAARLQEVAEPNSVILSEQSYQLVASSFVCDSLGVRQLKGIAAPLPVYKIQRQIKPSDAALAEDAESRSLTSLIGREQELQWLQGRASLARQGTGQIALIRGEAGIGKSRLLRELRQIIGHEFTTTLTCRCSIYHRHSALFPLLQLTQRVLHFQPEDNNEERYAKINAGLKALGLPPAEHAPLIAELLSLGRKTTAGASLNPRTRHRRTLEVFLEIILRMTERGPLLGRHAPRSAASRCRRSAVRRRKRSYAQ